jgi:hypothetical protein
MAAPAAFRGGTRRKSNRATAALSLWRAADFENAVPGCSAYRFRFPCRRPGDGFEVIDLAGVVFVFQTGRHHAAAGMI